jgi:hypothetical protein
VVLVRARPTLNPSKRANGVRAGGRRLIGCHVTPAPEGTRAAFGIDRALTRENVDRTTTGSERDPSGLYQLIVY